MINEKEIIELLKGALKSYIKCLERSDFDYLEYKGQVMAYLNVLNRDEYRVEFLALDKSKELLNKIVRAINCR